MSEIVKKKNDNQTILNCKNRYVSVYRYIDTALFPTSKQMNL